MFSRIGVFNKHWKLNMVSFPKMRKPHISAASLGLSNHVYYDAYNPNDEQATDVRASLAGLDYSPLRRVTLASFNMGILISMGGFM